MLVSYNTEIRKMRGFVSPIRLYREPEAKYLPISSKQTKYGIQVMPLVPEK